MRIAFTASLLATFAAAAYGKPVDLTGQSCVRVNQLGTQTWDFYGDVAMQYYEDGSVSRLQRVGVGAYEKYRRTGEWMSIYYFFDIGDGVQLRLLSAPGLLELDENPNAPLKSGIYEFNADCRQLWENR